MRRAKKRGAWPSDTISAQAPCFPVSTFPGLSVLVRYAEGRDAINASTGVGLPTVREGDLDVIWNVPGVPGLQFRFRNAYVAEGGARVLQAFRIILNYELPLL